MHRSPRPSHKGPRLRPGRSAAPTAAARGRRPFRQILRVRPPCHRDKPLWQKDLPPRHTPHPSPVPRAAAGLPRLVAALPRPVAGHRRSVAGLPASVAGLPRSVAGHPCAIAGLPPSVAGHPCAVAGLPRPTGALPRDEDGPSCLKNGVRRVAGGHRGWGASLRRTFDWGAALKKRGFCPSGVPRSGVTPFRTHRESPHSSHRCIQHSPPAAPPSMESRPCAL